MSDPYFRPAVAIVLEHEGVLSNDKYDPGGMTKYGIAQKFHPEVNVVTLTKEQAIEIYHRKYWLEYKCDQLPWWAALLVFDTVVNMGPDEAIPFLQTVVGSAVDGRIGPKTIAATKAVKDHKRAIALYMKQRIHAYMKKGNWERYKNGWTTRTYEVAMEAAVWPF